MIKKNKTQTFENENENNLAQKSYYEDNFTYHLCKKGRFIDRFVT